MMQLYLILSLFGVAILAIPLGGGFVFFDFRDKKFQSRPKSKAHRRLDVVFGLFLVAVGVGCLFGGLNVMAGVK